MCGICGVIGETRSELAESRLRSMLAGMIHRGPDDEGVLTKPGAVLGMRRLSIIDLAGGHQPVFNEDGTVGIVFNGEIYNFSRFAGLARKERPPFPHPFRHRSHRPRLRGMGRALRDASPRHVRLRRLGRPRRARETPASCWRATAWASSRFITQSLTAHCCLLPRSARCLPAAPSLAAWPANPSKPICCLAPWSSR